MKKMINAYHIFSVINILFDEMAKDLDSGKSIKIVNFGTLLLKDTPARKFHNINLRKMSFSPGYRILRFFLTDSIKKKLCSLLDIDKKNENS